MELTRTAWLAMLAGVFVLGWTAVYLRLITGEGWSLNGPVPVLFAAIMAACGWGAISGARARERSRRRKLLAWSAAGMFVIGVLGMFTIGLPLVVAAIATVCSIPMGQREMTGTWP